MSVNTGEWNSMVAGKSQYRYALQVLEDIALGGKILTILAGGFTQSVVAGATSFSTLAGATTFNNPAGAFTVTVGTGALGMTVAAGAVTLSTAAGAMSLSAAAGAMSLTAGLALNLTSAVAVNVVAPQILLGGPAAVLGIVRGVPSLPPGAPTLDYITNIPLLGSATVRSL
jgi:ABC-type Na+ efflux pump permease subunit